MQLPDFARDSVGLGPSLTMGIGEIEELVRRCPRGDVVRLGPPGAQELVLYMNSQQEWSGHIERIYWSVSPVTLQGVVDQVRTALTVLVSEINAHTPKGIDTPTAEVATNAITFAVSGKRNVIHVTSAQGGSTIAMPATTPDKVHWLRIVGAIILGLVAIAAAVFGLMQVQSWSF